MLAAGTSKGYALSAAAEVKIRNPIKEQVEWAIQVSEAEADSVDWAVAPFINHDTSAIEK